VLQPWYYHGHMTRPASAERSLPDASAHERLLEAAKELFAALGYENVSTSAVARRAGTSESQLIKHFGSKEGLLQAVFDKGWEALDWRVKLAWRGATSPLEKFVALASTLINAIGEDPRLRALLLLQGRRIRKRGNDVVLSHGFRGFVHMLDDLFRDMKRAGELRDGLHLEAVRSALLGAMEALLRDQLMAEMIDYPASYGRKDVLALFTTLAGALLEPAAARSLAEAAAWRDASE
jgi:AcrR family transcriptional regulator